MSKVVDWSQTGTDEWGDWARISDSPEVVSEAKTWDDLPTNSWGETAKDVSGVQDTSIFGDTIEWGTPSGSSDTYSKGKSSDLSEKFEWAKKKVQNLSNYNGPVDKAVISEALSKLSIKAFKEIAKVLDEDDYDAMCVIMDAVGYKEEFIKETQGGNTSSIATPIMDECLDQLNDVMVGLNAMKHPMYYKLQSMAMVRVNGGKPKSQELYEMLNEMVKHKLVNPEQIGTDASKMELSLCLNKMKEFYKTNNNDFGFDSGWDLGNSNGGSDWSWDTGSSGMSSDSLDSWSDWDTSISGNNNGNSLFGASPRTKKTKRESVFGDDLDYNYGNYGNSNSESERIFEI